jgi:8-oxo-dGTP pyrophosphatase MutT (NUDIX family)
MNPPLGSVKLSVQGCGAFATSNSHAVKALIYDSGGRLLLQQRDDRPDLLFPGCWTFFGGLVEEGETGQVFQAPRSDYARSLLAAMPDPDPDRSPFR